MTELELLIDLHKNAKRQGQGSNEDTLKAFYLWGISLDLKAVVQITTTSQWKNDLMNSY